LEIDEIEALAPAEAEEAAPEADEAALEAEEAPEVAEAALMDEVMDPPEADGLLDPVVVIAPVGRPLVEAEAFKHELEVPCWITEGEL